MFRKFLFLSLFLPSMLFSQEMSEWEVVYNEDGSVINMVDFFDDQYAVAVGDDGLVLLTTDGGTNWTNYSQSGVDDFITVEVISKDLVLACTKNSVYKAVDVSKAWTRTFNKDDVEITRVMNAMTSDDKGVFLCCKKGKVFSSHSNGDKWYPMDLKGHVDNKDDVLYCIAGKFDGVNDTLALLINRKSGEIYTEDYFSSLKTEDDFLGDVDIKVVNDHFDFSFPRFGEDNVLIGEDNSMWRVTNSKAWHAPGTQVLNCGLTLRHLLGDQWYGYAVGDNGYIAEAVAKSFGTFKKVTAPTGNDLNWIDWGADPDHNGGYSTATICAVGDGVILQKRWGWGPVSSPRISYDIHTDVYPNPFASYFKIESRGWDQNEKMQARLYDINGVLIKELYNGVLPEGELQLEVVEELLQGVYFIELSSGSKREVKRLVKS